MGKYVDHVTVYRARNIYSTAFQTDDKIMMLSPNNQDTAHKHRGMQAEKIRFYDMIQHQLSTNYRKIGDVTR